MEILLQKLNWSILAFDYGFAGKLLYFQKEIKILPYAKWGCTQLIQEMSIALAK